MPQRSAVEKLAWDLKVTAGCRFNAASRLGRREKSSNILNSLYSALLICISIATFSLPFDSNWIRYASFGGIVASILLLVMSMRSFAHQYGVEAEQMHRCALEINELRRLLVSLNPEEAERQISEFSQKYNAILQKWSINHTEQDFLFYKYKHKWEFDDIANLEDKALPDRKFQELYDISVAGVAFATLVGAAFIVFIAYMLWQSVSYSESNYSEADLLNAVENADAAANAALEAALQSANATIATLKDRQDKR